MSKQEWFSALIGVLLIGSAIEFVRRHKNMPHRAPPLDSPPVEILAEKLKEAWSEHHTKV